MPWKPFPTLLAFVWFFTAGPSVICDVANGLTVYEYACVLAFYNEHWTLFLFADNHAKDTQSHRRHDMATIVVNTVIYSDILVIS